MIFRKNEKYEFMRCRGVFFPGETNGFFEKKNTRNLLRFVGGYILHADILDAVR